MIKWISILLISTSLGFTQGVGEVAVVPDDTTNSLGIAQEVGEIAAVPDDTTKDPGLKAGDLAPSWALMYAPGKFEFLKNWTVERDKKLRKFMSQPNRYPMVLSSFIQGTHQVAKKLKTIG